MLKKWLLALMMSAIVLGGVFTSCKNDDDDDDVVIDAYASYYGTYTGSMEVTFNGRTTTSDLSIVVAKKSVNLGGRYGEYTKVLWFKNSDGKAVQAAQSDDTNTDKGDLTADNYTTASSDYIVFNGDGTATYYVPAMAAMGGTAALTKQ